MEERTKSERDTVDRDKDVMRKKERSVGEEREKGREGT